MASPFKLFRKNQKIWLAGLTIVAMGGFVVLPTVVQMVGDGNQAAALKDVVTTTRYGNLSRIGLGVLQSERQAVRRFMGEVDRLVRMKQRNSQGPTLAQMLSTGLSTDEEALVETWLLVNHAEELGIVIDDMAVNAFIQQVTEGVVTQSEMMGLLDSVGLPESQLFRLLGYELKALRIQELVQSGLVPMTPGERWDYYQRLHRNMSIELAEVPVERFVGSVSDPDDATLKKFFDKYKEKENIPELPEPGFKIPKRIAIEYFKVDPDHLFAPGELEKYYEEHKEEFKLPDVKPSDPAPELKGSLPGLADPELDLPPADQPAPEMTEGSESKPEPSEPEGEEKQAEKPETGETKDDTPKAAQAESEETKEEATEPKTEDTPKPTDESQAGTRSLFQLAAYQAGEEEKTAEKPVETKEEQPVSDLPSDSQASGEEKRSPAEEKPADEKTGDEKAAESKAEEARSDAAPEEPEPAKEMSADEEATAPSEDATSDAPSALDVDMPKFDPPSEYSTFEEVKSQIQNRLAPDKIERIFRPLENQMALYYDAHIRYIREQDDQGRSSVPEPPRPDFAKLAADAGIEAKKSELFSQREGSDLQLDIARSSVTAGAQPVHFLLYAFDSLAELRPARSQDVEGNYYLFWKTQQEAERVPTLEEEGIRSMVVGAWKMIEAREAAQAEAERLAAEARAKQEAAKEPVPLATAFSGEPGITVRSTEPFAWFDTISIQLYMMGYGQPRLSTIELVAPEPKEGETPSERETVPFVGTDFMRTVASLDKGSVAVAWNEPKTIAYVVRMVDTTPGTKELQSLFLSSANPRQLGIVASMDRRETFREWIKSLEATVGLEWRQ